MLGEGHSSGAPPVESVKEYKFFVPRKVNGIVVNDGGLHDLGLKVMIHRSGALRGIRIKAANLVVSLGAVLQERVDSSDLDQRVHVDFPSSIIEPLGLRYSLGATSAEPRRAYQVARRTLVDGYVVNSRAKIVYYSITDASKAGNLANAKPG
jgi:hypothetical protein